MKLRRLEPWIHLAILALLLGLLLSSSGACRTKTECACASRGTCGECITYQDRLQLQEEVTTNLQAIYVAEISYFSNANTYSLDFQAINWYPLADHRYAYFLPNETIQPDVTEPYALPAGLAPAVGAYGFTAVAVGDIDCDDALDVWTINDAKVMRNLTNDVVE